MTEMNCTTSRPPMPVVNAESIPAKLKEAQQWLNWSYKLDGDRHTKAPLGGPGYAQRLLTFAQALANCSETVGLGFYLSNGWIGFDWDKLDDDARVAASAIIDSLPCYSETSVSGKAYTRFVVLQMPRCSAPLLQAEGLSSSIPTRGSSPSARRTRSVACWNRVTIEFGS